MTAETINKNINRLYQFLNVDESERDSFEGWHEPKVILQVYGHILDCHGLPRSGLSTLYLPPEEYAEMEKAVLNPAASFIYQHEDSKPIDNNGQTLYRPLLANFGLMYDGFYWHIQKVNS